MERTKFAAGIKKRCAAVELLEGAQKQPLNHIKKQFLQNVHAEEARS